MIMSAASWSRKGTAGTQHKIVQSVSQPWLSRFLSRNQESSRAPRLCSGSLWGNKTPSSTKDIESHIKALEFESLSGIEFVSNLDGGKKNIKKYSRYQRNGCQKCVIFLFWKRYFLPIKGCSNMCYYGRDSVIRIDTILRYLYF